MTKPPAAAPLAAVCKAPEWCGVNLYERDDRTEEDRRKTRAFLDPANESYGFTARHEDKIRCSEPCVPPLAAQPAETKPMTCGVCDAVTDEPYHCGEEVKPAPQPATACAHGCSDTQANTACPTHGKPVPAKGRPKHTCINSSLGKCDGAILLRWLKGWSPAICDAHYLMTEAGVAENMQVESTGTPYTGPERLERPKLAHSYGVECPALEDA
jgi:hypothetical protein